MTPANPEPALLSDPPQESEAAAPRSEEAAAQPSYGDFKLPEGVTVDAESLKPATELFAETGLSQEQAQKFIDLAMCSAKPPWAQGTVQAFVDLQNQWASEIKAGSRISAATEAEGVLASANRVRSIALDVSTREALNFTGAGNHPAVVKARSCVSAR